MNSTSSITRATSSSRGATPAVKEFYEGLFPEGRPKDPPSLIVFFASSHFDREELTEQIHQHFADLNVIGCTTAGEISPSGLTNGTITGFSLPAADFESVRHTFENVDRFEYTEGEEAVKSLLPQLSREADVVAREDTFAFLMVDGLSAREEAITAACHNSLGSVQLFGGSAGDGTDFKNTWVYADGEFARNRAILTLVRTDHPFVVFRTQHFVATDKRIVVTSADPRARTVRELDGLPAGPAYAQLLGLELSELNSEVFAKHPVVVKMGGEYFVRSIVQMNPDHSITFACAIDEGVVLRLADGVDIVDNLEQAFCDAKKIVGSPELVIGCDCIFRRIEIDQRQLREPISEILQRNNVIGFGTYGEQFNSVHVNQTFTGVAIGPKKAA